MIRRHRTRPGDTRLLPGSRTSGPMPWVITIMTFLTVLVAAAGLGLSHAGTQLRADLAARATVQIIAADPGQRQRQTDAALRALAHHREVAVYRQVDQDQLEALLAPWLGDSLETDGVPVPAMIDITLRHDDPATITALTKALRTVAPSARIDSHAAWLVPVESLIHTLRWLSIGLILLIAAATTATVVLATRAALDLHRDTIDVLHLLGASDRQIAHLFQRRIAVSAMIGGLVGFAGAVLAILVIGQRIAGLGSDLLDTVMLAPDTWALLIMLPLLGTGLAMATARHTILGMLGRIL